jgi:hypothetical protein
MSQNELSAIGIALFIGFALLRGLFRMLRNAGRDGGSAMARINAAAERVLKEQKTGRSAVPLTLPQRTQSKNAIGTAAKKPRPGRTGAGSQKALAQQASYAPQRALSAGAGLPRVSSPAVVRTRFFSGAKEPVIQRRR